MEEPELITPEQNFKKEYNINNRYKLKIERENDETTFIIKDIYIRSKYYYIKIYKELKEINFINELKDFDKIIENNEYKIIDNKDNIIIRISIKDKEYDIILGKKTLNNEECINELFNLINIQSEEINNLKILNKDKDNKIKQLEENYNELFKDIKPLKNENGIKIIYKTNKKGKQKIFGKNFVEINKKNIELNINGKKNKLIEEYNLEEGYNNIKIIIKENLINFGYMFYERETLYNIDELKYLYTDYCNNFSYMFFGCSLLNDIKSLEKWNVSNVTNFSGMFRRCSLLKDIMLFSWSSLE